MPYYAVRVEFEFDMDDGVRTYFDEETRAGAFEAVSAKAATAMARESLRPQGARWEAVLWDVVECADSEDATRVARGMERRDWGCWT